ncbi:hypothetical protein RO3G_03114 [Rhizopus delemar RA 99-880]|uniref:Reverse transcriptase domain-containing protein n=1 Tax=Rhizopus delemar (strain RA 99-880 / ATCC MYA-4621 / FGSC 9543 / NRRL 43880) TaxID=246409 RepID=I1BQD0_RHIO9|nr:hypothetical protein RO3G_03114 [Rhizopus delemar RA 99-880]|eukprot:EIE78410.1 hypothetical protein RO3G_03114 [Rhizopus delemar RA 99-880]
MFTTAVIAEGYHLQFRSQPSPWKIKPMKLSPLDQEAISVAVNNKISICHPSESNQLSTPKIAIEKFLTVVIIEVSASQSESYLSNFFTIQEPTKRRLILDCSQLNQFLQYQHFKIEGVPALRHIIEKDDLMCKLDLKDAYVVVPIHPTSQQYSTFKHQGVVQWVKKLHQRNSFFLKYQYSSVSLTSNITKLGTKRVTAVSSY